MLFVEEVARSLDPQVDIWKTPQPIVADCIKKSIGPRAVLRDLSNSAQVLTRFGPGLPALVEAALIRQSTPTPALYQNPQSSKLLWGDRSRDWNGSRNFNFKWILLNSHERISVLYLCFVNEHQGDRRISYFNDRIYELAGSPLILSKKIGLTTSQL
tara:strand:- start:403 stop:873 length:471 start_codon:yes stop_codon:yes gene_type:complete